MGTRGAICFVADGREKTTYNHWDSYPSGLGIEVLMWVRDKVVLHEEGYREAVGELQPVPEDGEPTDEQIEALSEFWDPNVSTGRDWYALLRATQGRPDAILRAGYYGDAETFPLDSLWCEWAYVVDFDQRCFEVYKGFQKGVVHGRWAARQSREEYSPVTLIRAWSFDNLPEVEEVEKL